MIFSDEKLGQVTIECETEAEAKLMRSVLIPILKDRGVKFHQNRGGDFITFLAIQMQDDDVFKTIDLEWEKTKAIAFFGNSFACHSCKTISKIPTKCSKCGKPVTKIERKDYV